jgi:hypothetical protein
MARAKKIIKVTKENKVTEVKPIIEPVKPVKERPTIGDKLVDWTIQ